jgi:hypothetical protein
MPMDSIATQRLFIGEIPGQHCPQFRFWPEAAMMMQLLLDAAMSKARANIAAMAA